MDNYVSFDQIYREIHACEEMACCNLRVGLQRAGATVANWNRVTATIDDERVRYTRAARLAFSYRWARLAGAADR